jgi:hypothetical protein
VKSLAAEILIWRLIGNRLKKQQICKTLATGSAVWSYGYYVGIQWRNSCTLYRIRIRPKSASHNEGFFPVLDVREECGNTKFRWEGHENLGISVSGVLGVLPDGAGFA